jgi:hypothetical protein
MTFDAHPARRIAQHLAGKGSNDTKAAFRAGIKMTMAVHWSGPDAGADFERFIKDGMDTAQWCPLCGRNEKPVPKLSDMTPMKRAQRRAAASSRKPTPEQLVDRMIRDSYGQREF